VEKVSRAGGDEPSPIAKPITGTGLEAGPEAPSSSPRRVRPLADKLQAPNEERGGDTI
jgi:hypothetical protein